MSHIERFEVDSSQADIAILEMWHHWFVSHWGCEPLFVVGETKDGAVQLVDALNRQPDPQLLEAEFLETVDVILKTIEQSEYAF